MADQSDVEAALVNLIADTLYPSGTSSPNAVGALGKVTLTSAGTGGTPGTYPLTFAGGGGSGAAGDFVVGASGAIAAAWLNDGGALYGSAPTVGLGGSSGVTGAAITASIADIRVFRGWPNPQVLDADLAAGIENVSVFGISGMARNTTRYFEAWETLVAPTMSIAVMGGAAGAILVDDEDNPIIDQDGNIIQLGDGEGWDFAFTGTVAPNQLVGIATGGHAYAYKPQAGDDAIAIAAAFATAIPGASSDAGTLSLPTLPNDVPLGRVVGIGTALLQTRRQMQVFDIDFWCSTPALRDATASLVDAVLARTRWLPLSDGTVGHLLWCNSCALDATEKDNLWRRTLRYSVEYATTLVEQQPSLLWPLLNLRANRGRSRWLPPGRAAPIGPTQAADIWFTPNEWYPDPTSGSPSVQPPSDILAFYAPGAAWQPSKITTLFVTPPGTDALFHAGDLGVLAAWASANPEVKIAINCGMMALGNSTCRFSGEGASQEADYQSVPIIALTRIRDAGGRIDIVCMDTPLTSGFLRCGFTAAQTVQYLVGTAQQIIALFPDVEFSLEQGPVTMTDAVWISRSLAFFQEFESQVGRPVKYANFDLHLFGDVRNPPTPLWDTVATAAQAFTEAGIKVGLYCHGNPDVASTAADYIISLRTFIAQANSRNSVTVPLNQLVIDPFEAYHLSMGFEIANLPDTSPKSTTSVLL